MDDEFERKYLKIQLVSCMEERERTDHVIHAVDGISGDVPNPKGSISKVDHGVAPIDDLGVHHQYYQWLHPGNGFLLTHNTFADLRYHVLQLGSELPL
jgi:hypothetical protein